MTVSNTSTGTPYYGGGKRIPLFYRRGAGVSALCGVFADLPAGLGTGGAGRSFLPRACPPLPPPCRNCGGG